MLSAVLSAGALVAGTVAPVPRAWAEMRDGFPESIRLKADFSTNRTGRANADVPVRLDLSNADGLAFDVTVDDLSQFSEFTCYLKSGDGWYNLRFAPEREGVSERIYLRKKSAGKEGTPGGWDSIALIRISGWRSGTNDTTVVLSRFAKVSEAEVAEAEKKLDRAARPCPMPDNGEFRAFWCHSAQGLGEGYDWDSSIRYLKRHGYNAIIANLSWPCVAFYRSKVLPESKTLATGGDRLEQCLKACRKYGVQCHVWKVCWNMGWAEDCTQFAAEMKAAGRTQVRTDSQDGAKWLCPSHPLNRKMEIDAMAELAGKGIDGIHFDYIRYPGDNGCYCDGCRARFEKTFGRPVANWPKDLKDDVETAKAWKSFRVANITAVVKAVSARVRREHPKTAISAAVFQNPESTPDTLAQDWLTWCKCGYLDFVCPMNYVDSAALQRASARMQLEAVRGTGVKVYPGIGLSVFRKDGCDARRLSEQIAVLRELGVPGFTVFNFDKRAQAALPEILTATGLANRSFDVKVGRRQTDGERKMAVKPLVTTARHPCEVRENLFDFGKAAFGWLELRDVARGDYEVTIGEMTNAEGHVANPCPGSSIRTYSVTCRVESARQVVALPVDRLNTTGWDPKAPAVLLPPKFPVVAPFRYAEVTKGADRVRAANLVRQMVHYPIDMGQSSFSCDNEILNEVYELCKHTILATSFCGVYVDGDRERTPYEADAYINQLCQYAIDADYSLARRSHEWLMDHPTWPTEWKQHSIKMAWADWMWTGDTRSLAKNYERLQRKLLGNYPRRDIVDWPPSERDGFVMTNSNSVVDAFNCRNLVEMSEIAAALGKREDAERYAREADMSRMRFVSDYFDSERGLFRDAREAGHMSLHANAAALAFGLVPPDRVDGVASYLAEKGLACSVYFAQYLLEALFEAGRSDVAVKLMASTGERSWKAMIDFGSTMTMEAWNVRAKPNLDLNHAWGAAPLNLISRYVLGVTPLKPGFEELSVRPQVGGLRRVRGVVPTSKGPVEVKIDDDVLAVTVPAIAKVVWKGRTSCVEAGEHRFW